MITECPSVCGNCSAPANESNPFETEAAGDEYYYDGDYEGYYQEWMARIGESSDKDEKKDILGGSFSFAGLVGIVALVVVLAGVVAYHYRSINKVKKTVNFMTDNTNELQMQMEKIDATQQDLTRKVFNDSDVSGASSAFWDDPNEWDAQSMGDTPNKFDQMYDQVNQGSPKKGKKGKKAAATNSKLRMQPTDESLEYDTADLYKRDSNFAALDSIIPGFSASEHATAPIPAPRPKMTDTAFSSPLGSENEEDDEAIYEMATNVNANASFNTHLSPTYDASRTAQE